MSQSASPSIFEFHTNTVRVVIIDGEPWFVASDVATALGYRDAANAARNLKDRQKGTHNLSTPGGGQKVTVITESGLYKLVLRSRKPEAEEFSDWVTGEVLPSIRKTGGYGKRDHQFVQDAILASSRIAAEAQQHIFAALMNDEDWRNHRWIMNFIPDRRDGKLFANIMQIASDDMCVSMKNLAARILDVAGSHPTDQQLNDIAIACNQRLSWRIQHREKQEAAKKSQAGGALAVA